MADKFISRGELTKYIVDNNTNYTEDNVKYFLNRNELINNYKSKEDGKYYIPEELKYIFNDYYKLFNEEKQGKKIAKALISGKLRAFNLDKENYNTIMMAKENADKIVNRILNLPNNDADKDEITNAVYYLLGIYEYDNIMTIFNIISIMTNFDFSKDVNIVSSFTDEILQSVEEIFKNYMKKLCEQIGFDSVKEYNEHSKKIGKSRNSLIDEDDIERAIGFMYDYYSDDSFEFVNQEQENIFFDALDNLRNNFE